MKERPKRVQKPGLWHGPTRIEVETVKRAHKLPCVHCHEIPEGRRLVIVEGSGTRAKKRIYCAVCGESWLSDHAAECERARAYLATGEGTIR